MTRLTKSIFLYFSKRLILSTGSAKNWTTFLRPAFISLFSTAIFSLITIQQGIQAFAAQKTGTLAFIGGDGKHFNLYTFDPNGLHRHQLSQKPNVDIPLELVWSKNGRKLAFITLYASVYVANADGSNISPVLSDFGLKAPRINIIWASNDRKLIFTFDADGSSSDLPGNSSLYISDTTGIPRTKLVKSVNSNTSSFLCLSSNGEKVIFFKDKNIYIMNIDGSELTKLGDAPSEFAAKPNWSPDNKQFAFSSGEPHPQIYLVDIEKKTVKNLTNDPKEEAYEGFSAWSPNGNQLAYYHHQRNNPHDPYNQVDINLLDIRRGTVRKLTDKPGEYRNLKWSPDGKQIAFTKGNYTHQNLYVMSIDNSNLTQINPKLTLSFDSNFSWSRDSQKIAFTIEEKTNQKALKRTSLYVVNRDGLNLVKLLETKDLYISELTWKP
jgi:Tol biopolymer transport system component